LHCKSEGTGDDDVAAGVDAQTSNFNDCVSLSEDDERERKEKMKSAGRHLEREEGKRR
jgi:hypothetical protein